nr:MAG TPA: hypothetical protein [Caudoviricetes sp.]
MLQHLFLNIQIKSISVISFLINLVLYCNK